jgi:hypothetical protein
MTTMNDEQMKKMAALVRHRTHKDTDVVWWRGTQIVDEDDESPPHAEAELPPKRETD